MEKKMPTLHYMFAHRVLRDIVFNDVDFFMKIVREGPGFLAYYLDHIWDKTKKLYPDLRNMDTRKKEDLFKLSLTQLENKDDIINISMPSFVEPPEAAAVAVLLNKENTRYFVLEYEKNEVTGVSFMVCEWERERKACKLWQY